MTRALNTIYFCIQCSADLLKVHFLRSQNFTFDNFAYKDFGQTLQYFAWLRNHTTVTFRSSGAVTYSLHELLQYPEVQRKANRLLITRPHPTCNTAQHWSTLCNILLQRILLQPIL